MLPLAPDSRAALSGPPLPPDETGALAARGFASECLALADGPFPRAWTEARRCGVTPLPWMLMLERRPSEWTWLPVRRSLKRAGIDAPTTGAHQFRHGLASEMLRGGASLGEIGEVLGHRHVQTTAIYAKVDLNALRTLALPWPGDAQ
ncbi:tyrosine-type recombinase/integrase [Mesorhizobium waimense]|uniref:tyrosine-type recombinase/integrase n=1 Tax=Mesorhizobium waimense TaxID=1300307 RepID=UPI00315CA807